MNLPERPITILVAALGGEGGGVLADWLVAAATAESFPVQSTSIPGVAQRTGATTYYVEIYPARWDTLDGKRPVLALTPAPGNVDLMVASEIIESARAMQNGYVSPDRTTLIASTHRVYTVLEKMSMGDGRINVEKIMKAADKLARRAILFDMADLAVKSGTVISAVLFGAMAGSGTLPLSRTACEDAIRKAGKGVEASLKGFDLAYRHATGELKAATLEDAKRWKKFPVERVAKTFPPETHRIVEEGVARTTDYQDAAYASLYLDRIEPILAFDREKGGGGTGYKLTNETARFLALWMSYEDVIRVADLKTRRSRFERVRNEVRAKPYEPVQIVEFLKPGVEEIAAVMPSGIASAMLNWEAGRRKRGLPALHKGMYIKTNSITGFLMLRTLAWLRPLRRKTSRFPQEQALIERWLRAVANAGKTDLELALEVALLGRLIKGYGDTHQRGKDNFLRIMDTLVEAGTVRDPQVLRMTVRAARDAALADPDGKVLDGSLEKVGVPRRPVKAHPIQIVRRKPGQQKAT